MALQCPNKLDVCHNYINVTTDMFHEWRIFEPTCLRIGASIFVSCGKWVTVHFSYFPFALYRVAIHNGTGLVRLFGEERVVLRRWRGLGIGDDRCPKWDWADPKQAQLAICQSHDVDKETVNCARSAV